MSKIQETEFSNRFKRYGTEEKVKLRELRNKVLLDHEIGCRPTSIRLMGQALKDMEFLKKHTGLKFSEVVVAALRMAAIKLKKAKEKESRGLL